MIRGIRGARLGPVIEDEVLKAIRSSEGDLARLVENIKGEEDQPRKVAVFALIQLGGVFSRFRTPSDIQDKIAYHMYVELGGDGDVYMKDPIVTFGNW